jgi:hypothetical protein
MLQESNFLLKNPATIKDWRTIIKLGCANKRSEENKYDGSDNIFNAFQMWMKAIIVLSWGNKAVGRALVNLMVIKKIFAAKTKLVQAQVTGL